MRGCTCTGNHWCSQCQALAVRAGILDVPTPPPLSEKVFMDAVIRLAKEHHWLVWHAYTARKSPAGYPDLTLCHPSGQRPDFCRAQSARRLTDAGAARLARRPDAGAGQGGRGMAAGGLAKDRGASAPLTLVHNQRCGVLLGSHARVEKALLGGREGWAGGAEGTFPLLPLEQGLVGDVDDHGVDGAGQGGPAGDGHGHTGFFHRCGVLPLAARVARGGRGGVGGGVCGFSLCARACSIRMRIWLLIGLRPSAARALITASMAFGKRVGNGMNSAASDAGRPARRPSKNLLQIGSKYAIQADSTASSSVHVHHQPGNTGCLALR